MHILIGLLALIGAGVYWAMRTRNAANATAELGNMAVEVAAAARRLGFRMRHDEHPVDSLSDPKVALAGAAVAFLELSDLPSRDEQDALLRALQSNLDATKKEAGEMMVLGRWLVQECGSPDAGLKRLAKRLKKLDPNALQPLLSSISTALQDSGTSLGDRQREALEDISRAFGVR